MHFRTVIKERAKEKPRQASDARAITAAATAIVASQFGCWVPQKAGDNLLENGLNEAGYRIRGESEYVYNGNGGRIITTEYLVDRHGSSEVPWTVDMAYDTGSMGIILGSAILGVLAARTAYRAIMGNRKFLLSETD